jgi:hypothetical protein
MCGKGQDSLPPIKQTPLTHLWSRDHNSLLFVAKAISVFNLSEVGYKEAMGDKERNLSSLFLTIQV